MSKSSLKKFKKNDYWNEEEEDSYENRSRYLEKKKHKRVERALRTKDISILTEEDDMSDIEWDDQPAWSN
jgi:hypothetical protein